MKAMVLLNDVATHDEVGLPILKHAENALYSMGIDVFTYYMSSATDAAPNDAETITALCDTMGISLIVIPRWTGSTYTYYRNITSSMENMTVPVFVVSMNSMTSVEGATGLTAAASRKATITRTGGTIYNKGIVTALTTETAPAATTAILTDATDTSIICDWKYTPDGTHYVYWSAQESENHHLHLLIQEAVEDGVLAAPPKRAPLILNIDHVNDGGDDETGGFQEQPARLAEAGAILRGAGAICYSNIEVRWVNGVKGTTTGDLLTNLTAYGDVFKYIACHDHGQFYTAGTGANDAIDNQETKATIDTSYQATKTAIEGIGLTVNTDFAHCSQNRLGSNFLELAQPYTSFLAHPTDDTIAKAGYGFKVVRVANTPNVSDPHLPVNASNAITAITHWMKQKTIVRGMLMLANKDGGGANGGIVDLDLDFSAFAYNLYSLNVGVITYFHGADFEDASIRSGSVSTDGSAMTRAMLSWETGAAYATACANTVNFGADINDYYKPPTATITV